MRMLTKIRSIVIFSLMLIVMTCYAGAEGFHSLQPRQIVLTWQNNPQTTMTISWRTDQKGDHSFAFYSPKPDLGISSALQQTAKTFTFEETVAWIHTVELTELKPGETYWVILQTDDFQSEAFSFRTAPSKSEEVVFIMGADSQHLRTQMHVIQEVFKKIAEEDPAFFCYSGDFVNAELSDYEWDLFFDLWHELMITSEGRRIPIIPAIGNHEVVAGYGGKAELAPFYYQRFSLPDPEKYYVIQYGPDLSIISLDSNHTSQIDGEQLNWLKTTLEANRSIPWKIAHYHDGSWWGSEAMHVKIRTLWVPLFEEYRVNIAHSGHSHSYMRSAPIMGIHTYAKEIDAMVDKALSRAIQDYDPGKNYAPPLQRNLIQLSRGNWQTTGFESLFEGLKEMTYMLSLFVIQTGEPTKERVYDQISTTQLFAAYWNPILSGDNDHGLIDRDEGVLYLVGGGLGAELGSYRDPSRAWWIEESLSAHHYRRIVVDVENNELHVEPVFYFPQENRWEEMDAITIRK